MNAWTRPTAQRAATLWTIDPLDARQGTGYRIAFPSGTTWHLSAGPRGQVLVATEHNGLPVSLAEINEDFASLTPESAGLMAMIWRRALQPPTDVRKVRR